MPACALALAFSGLLLQSPVGAILVSVAVCMVLAWGGYSVAAAQVARHRSADVVPSIMNATPYPLFRVDSSRAVISHNEAFRQWFIRDSFPVVGRHMIDIMGADTWETLRNSIEEAYSTGSASTTLTFNDTHGTRRVTQAAITVETTPYAHTSGPYVVCALIPAAIRREAEETKQSDGDLLVQRYLSEVESSRQHLREQAEALSKLSAELTVARDQALSATTAKSAFLANMSHELRTPLNGIVTMSQLLCEEPLSPSQAEYADIIRTSSDALLAIINDILDFSKIEAGKLTISPQPFMLRDSINKLVALLKPQISAKSIVLTVHITDNVPDAMIGDDGRMRQVLINLLGNSIKFTDEGGIIHVFVDASEVANDYCVLQFAVSDSGIGIAADKLEKIFGAFDQEDATTTRHYGGTGLGLSISRRLIELMGGTMSVTSRKGVGSSFRFSLKLPLQSAAVRSAQQRQQKDREQQITSNSDKRSLKVLVAEDNQINQKVAVRLLSVLGHQAHVVSNGAEALRAWEGGGFDLILMDCHMPELDGYAATRAIRLHEEQTGKHIPIIGLTAATMKQELDRCIEVGMDDHMTKPVPKNMLQEKLDSLFIRRTEG